MSPAGSVEIPGEKGWTRTPISKHGQQHQSKDTAQPESRLRLQTVEAKTLFFIIKFFLSFFQQNQARAPARPAARGSPVARARVRATATAAAAARAQFKFVIGKKLSNLLRRKK
jgi:hypothetical protein